MLESTNKCSLACVHCTVSEKGHPHHRQNGYLPLALAEALFEDIARSGGRFDTLILFWLGEPLIHPRFADLYRAAVRASVRYGIFNKVELHSNATHLDAAAIQTALNRAKVPQTWHFSLDAVSAPVYRQIKGMDRQSLVYGHLMEFLDAQAARKAPWPRPVFQFIVSDKNAHEAASFKNYWEEACRQRGLPVRSAAQHVPPGHDAIVFFRQLDCPTPAEQSHQNQVFQQTMQQLRLSVARPERLSPIEAGGPAVCGCFWKSPVVAWNGQLSTCTRDNRLENSLGNLYTQSFSSLWWGPEMQAKRQQVAMANYQGLPACQGCFIPKSSNYADISPAEIAAVAP